MKTLSAIYKKHMKLDKDKIEGMLALTIVAAFIILMSWLLYSSYKAANVMPPADPCIPRKLKQIVTDNTTTASGGMIFLIGSLSVDEEPVYRAYYQKDNGGYALLNLRTEYAEIFEDTDRPYLIFCGESDNLQNEFDSGRAWKKHVQFHVPPNSISNEIDINLKNIK